MSATEGTTIVIGDDVMFASHNQVRADDAHPIFDVRTGQRVNVSKSIEIGVPTSGSAGPPPFSEVPGSATAR
jgi:hypothetical protein